MIILRKVNFWLFLAKLCCSLRKCINPSAVYFYIIKHIPWTKHNTSNNIRPNHGLFLYLLASKPLIMISPICDHLLSQHSCPLRIDFFRLQCTCTVPTTSGMPHGSLLVWACQSPSSQPLSSPQLSHNNSI